MVSSLTRSLRTIISIICISPGKPKPLIDLNCKVALITGGSDGIGLAVAHEILAENVKNVALVGIDNVSGREAVQKLNSCYGRDKAIFFNCDVQNKLQVTGKFYFFLNGIWNLTSAI